MTAPKPPDSLGESGRTLWRATLKDYELSAHELALLGEAAKTLDALDSLQSVLAAEGPVVDSPQGTKVNPVLPELRQQRMAFARLAAALGLPSGLEDDLAHQRRSVRGAYKPRAV